ncbi:hypothetical protein IJF81_06415 [bacterium]|nr:hypothetical protein [bacterium]
MSIEDLGKAIANTARKVVAIKQKITKTTIKAALGPLLTNKTVRNTAIISVAGPIPTIGMALSGKNKRNSNSESNEGKPIVNKENNSYKLDPKTKKHIDMVNSEIAKKQDNLKASNGMTYKNARIKLKQIVDKYWPESDRKDMIKCSKNPYLKAVYSENRRTLHYELDINKLLKQNLITKKEAQEYNKAKAAVDEICSNMPQEDKLLFNSTDIYRSGTLHY